MPITYENKWIMRVVFDWWKHIAGSTVHSSRWSHPFLLTWSCHLLISSFAFSQLYTESWAILLITGWLASYSDTYKHMYTLSCSHSYIEQFHLKRTYCKLIKYVWQEPNATKHLQLYKFNESMHMDGLATRLGQYFNITAWMRYYDVQYWVLQLFWKYRNIICAIILHFK